MKPIELLSHLTARGIALKVDGGQIMAKPVAALTLDDREAIRQHKAGLIALLQVGDALTNTERQQLMDATAERLRQQWRGQTIDFPAVERINSKIGRTFTHRELVTLLAEYAAAILRGGGTQ